MRIPAVQTKALADFGLMASTDTDQSDYRFFFPFFGSMLR
jgi:hypothetical protein